MLHGKEARMLRSAFANGAPLGRHSVCAPNRSNAALRKGLSHGRVAAKAHEIQRRGDHIDANRVRGSEEEPAVK